MGISVTGRGTRSKNDPLGFVSECKRSPGIYKRNIYYI